MLTSVALLMGLTACTPGQGPAHGTGAASGTAAPPTSDVQLVERVIAARQELQHSLEALRSYYIASKDLKRAQWAQDELIAFHRIVKEPFNLSLDVPPAKLQPLYPSTEANELYRRGMEYKSARGWGNDYVDNQHRAEIVLQELLRKHPQSDKIADTAYALGEIYEGNVFKQPHRAVVYYERVFQWQPGTQTDARLRAAKLYDHTLGERTKAMELYKDLLNRETDQRRTQEAQRRLMELSGQK
jgi:tetratricopeptide (TPR) repeat protein